MGQRLEAEKGQRGAGAEGFGTLAGTIVDTGAVAIVGPLFFGGLK